MQFGLCARLNRLEEAAALGFDYLELPLRELAALSAAEFDALLTLQRRLGVKLPAFNCLLPGSIRLFAPDFSLSAFDDYLELVFSRAEALGGRCAVFGSGASRTRPDSLPYGEAFRRLTALTRRIGDAAARHGLTVPVEPLHRAETNMILSVGEGACLAAAVNHPAVTLLSDIYHVACEGEDPADLLRVGGVQHVHVALLEGRRWPVEPGAPLTAFFAALRASGYDGLVSVEGRSEDWQRDAAPTLRTLRALARG